MQGHVYWKAKAGVIRDSAYNKGVHRSRSLEPRVRLANAYVILIITQCLKGGGGKEL